MGPYPIASNWLPLPPELEGQKKTVLILYILQLISIFSGGILAVVALIIAYIKLPDAKHPLLSSHLRWQIRTFWWHLLWLVLAFAPFLLLLTQLNDEQGILISTAIAIAACGLILVINYCWQLYRYLRGLFALNEERPMSY